MTIEIRKGKKRFLSDAIKYCADRIRAEFALLNPNDQDVRPYIDMFDSIMSQLEEFAAGIKEEIDFFDNNQFKQKIDTVHTKFNHEKGKRKDKDDTEKIKLENRVKAKLKQ